MSDKSWHHSHCFKSYGPNDFTCERPYAHGGDCGPMTHKPPQGSDAGYRRIEHSIVPAQGKDWPPILRDSHCDVAFLDKIVSLLNAAPPDPRKDLAALDELVEKWRKQRIGGRGARAVRHYAEIACADELEQRLAEMRGAKR